MKWKWTSQRNATAPCPVTDGRVFQGQQESMYLTVINQSHSVDFTDRRHLEARLQQWQNQLRIALDVAEAALKKKKRLLRQFKHRIKNNLQLINNLLIPRASRFQDRDIQDFFHECRMRIHALALVHDLLHKDSHLSGIDLHSFLVEYIQNLPRCY